MKKIAFITDIHLGEQFPIDNNVNPKENFEKVLADISERGITELVFGGDIGDESAHNYFFEKLNRFSLNLLIGNHDKFVEVKKHLSKEIKNLELYYAITDENYKYIFLDTSKDEISEIQIEWLKKEIITEKKVLIFMHHPVIQVVSAVDKLYPLKNREILKLVLLDHGKEITIFCGHYHMNNEIAYKNVRQIITQSLSFQIVKDAEDIEIDNINFGYRIITLENNKLETEIVNFKW